MIPRLLLFAVLLFTPPLASADWRLGDLYSDSELQHWQQRYPENVQWNFDNLILGRLTPAERRQLGTVRLDFPLRAAEELRDHPLQFYAGGRTITVPILSLLFFDELAQAWGYLWSNGKDLQLIGDYLAMLKFRDPRALAGGRFPAPLDALGIPKDAWKSDPKMDDVSQKALKSAIVWILAHEAAHIYHRHPGYGPGVSRAQAQANEAEADLFANTILRRIGTAPLGMVQFFMALAHLDVGRGDFASDAAWQSYLRSKATHPLTADRLHRLAADLRSNPEDFTAEEPDTATGIARLQSVSDEIARIGDILEDPDMHRLIAAIGFATDPASLRRQRRALPDVDPQNPCGEEPPPSNFSGEHTGLYTRVLPDGRKEWLPARMSLERSGTRVRGRFSFGAGEASMQGVLSGNERLLFDWQWGETAGKGTLHRNKSGVLEGAWGYGEDSSSGGLWTLCLRP